MVVENSAAANPNPAAEVTPGVIKSAQAEPEATVINQATDEQKAATAAEEQRLLDADVTTLSDEDKGKRTTLETTREEKRLIETSDEQLSDVDKAKKAELIKANDEAVKGNTVPEKYEFKVPEGMTLDQALADKVSPILKKGKVTQAIAQEITDAFSAHQQEQIKAQDATLKKFKEDSYKETITALGSEYKKELVFLARVRDRFFSEETQEMIDNSVLASNKAFVMDLIEIGKLISEDKIPGGRPATSAGELSAARTLYPNQGKK